MHTMYIYQYQYRLLQSTFVIDCQANIGGISGLYCPVCDKNGIGNCDQGRCPQENANNITYGTIFNNMTKKCEPCQHGIGGYDRLNCISCTVNGVGKCDPEGCLAEYSLHRHGVVYNNKTQLCEMCQRNIKGHRGLNCRSCLSNGPGFCDESGCPVVTSYNSSTNLCEVNPATCEYYLKLL